MTTTTESTVLNLEEKPVVTNTDVINEPLNFQPPPPPPTTTVVVEDTKTTPKPVEVNPVVIDDTTTTPKPVEVNPVVINDTTTIPKPVEVNPVVINDTTNIKPLTTGKSPLAGLKKTGKLAPVICGSTVSLVILGIISIIPLLQLIIGWHYADDCRINWRIPHYLVVAGAIGLTVIILTIVQGIFTLYTAKKTNDPISQTPAVAIVFGLCSISIILFFLFIFLIGWFIAGCIWVFREWNKVQYRNPNRSDYCHPTLYRFAFWFLFLSILYQIFSCFRTCNQTRKQMVNKKRGPAIPVPTTEP